MFSIAAMNVTGEGVSPFQTTYLIFISSLILSDLICALPALSYGGSAVAQWLESGSVVRAQDGDRGGLGSDSAGGTSLQNFGNSVYPALPVSFGGDTKSRRSLLSGVYARGSKRPCTGGKCVTCCGFYNPLLH